MYVYVYTTTRINRENSASQLLVSQITLDSGTPVSRYSMLLPRHHFSGVNSKRIQNTAILNDWRLFAQMSNTAKGGGNDQAIPISETSRQIHWAIRWNLTRHTTYGLLL